MTKIVRTRIRVLNDQRSVDWYKTAFDLDVVDQLEFENFRLTNLANAQTDFKLELALNKDWTVPYELGDGYAHLAFAVEYADAHHATFLHHRP